MKEATATGKLTPPVGNKRTVTHTSPVQTPSPEIEQTPANTDKSPPTKKQPPSLPSALDPEDSFESTAAGACREVNMLFSKLAEMLSESAAADTAQMKELEGILTQARNLESFLKQKKKHLKQTLAMISEKLLA